MPENFVCDKVWWLLGHFQFLHRRHRLADWTQLQRLATNQSSETYGIGLSDMY